VQPLLLLSFLCNSLNWLLTRPLDSNNHRNALRCEAWVATAGVALTEGLALSVSSSVGWEGVHCTNVTNKAIDRYFIQELCKGRGQNTTKLPMVQLSLQKLLLVILFYAEKMLHWRVASYLNIFAFEPIVYLFSLVVLSPPIHFMP